MKRCREGVGDTELHSPRQVRAVASLLQKPLRVAGRPREADPGSLYRYREINRPGLALAGRCFEGRPGGKPSPKATPIRVYKLTGMQISAAAPWRDLQQGILFYFYGKQLCGASGKVNYEIATRWKPGGPEAGGDMALPGESR